MPNQVIRVAVAIAALNVTAHGAIAQDNDFAKKTITIYIGNTAGGTYDLMGRLLARHLGHHLPGNPTVIADNMPGAGTLRAANYIYNVAPKDGSVLGIIARDAALGPLSGAPGARFDSTKLSWIGTPAKETNVCIAFHSAKV
jgi:tripartite-type tricarboxylate transporter receptor subunit TctC